MIRKATYIAVAALLFGLATFASVFAEDSSAADAPNKVEAQAQTPKVTIEADNARLKDLFEKVAEQSKEKIILESTVKGTVPRFSVTNVTVEAALTAICKSGKCEWRRVFLPADSKLLEQPERLASTVRLVTAMGFPEMLISGSSSGKVAAHYTQEKSVKSVQDIAAKDPSLLGVYVITNDALVAEKEKDKEDKSSALQDYVKQTKDLMDKFVKMTPEEQEQAMLESISQFENMDPGYAASIMRSFSRMDPEVFARMQNRGTDMMLQMSQDDRRAFLKMSMRAQSQMDPQVQQMLMEDAKAVMEELKAEQENNGHPRP